MVVLRTVPNTKGLETAAPDTLHRTDSGRPLHFGNLAADAAKVGFDDSFIYREFAQPLPQRKIPMLQMMREQALAAFHAWQEKPNKIPY